MTLPLTRAALCAAFVLSVAFPGTAAAQQTVSHAQGKTEIPAELDTVIVFDLASLDTLGALGIDVAGVPRTRLPDYIDGFEDAEYVGTLFEPDYEAVNALQPDLIIVGGRSAAKYDDLSRIAPTVDMTVDPENYLQSVFGNIETLGRIFVEEARAETLITKLRESIDELKAIAADAGESLLILTTGGRMSAYGPGSRFGVIHTGFGFKPAVPDLEVSLHGEAINAEFIMQADPDWLFVIDRDVAIGQTGAAQEVLDNDLVGRTTAWTKDQVVYLDPVSWYLVGGGARAMQSMVDQLTEAVEAAD